MLKDLDTPDLKKWIEDSLESDTNTLASGYQGKTLLYNNDEQKIVIKTPHGRGLVKYLHIRMLRHEAKAYQLLEHMEGIPKCYGLIDNKYLALELIEGDPIRNKRPVNSEKFYAQLFSAIENMHLLGVAHMDLKKKDNLMVTHHDQPCILDFGASIIKKQGFHPINLFLYRLARRYDYNAWIKHKYHDNMRNISDKDKIYFQRTYSEKIAKKLKNLLRL